MKDRFFDAFRMALDRLPAGLLRAEMPATPDELAETERALRRALPQDLADFLRSWNGAALFHETIVILTAPKLLVEANDRDRVPAQVRGGPWRSGDLVFAISGADAQSEDCFVM